MEQAEIVYQDRILKITKRPSEKGVKYTIEITDGRIRRSWEEYFNNDEEAIEVDKRIERKAYREGKASFRSNN